MHNQAQVIGYLGRDPEIYHLSQGGAIANFSVATSEKWRDKITGDVKEATEWHRINTYGKLTEIVEKYLRKGSRVFIQGKLRTRKWKDKDGNDHYTTEIRADDLVMLNARLEESGQTPHQQQQHYPSTQPAPQSDNFDIDNDIPF